MTPVVVSPGAKSDLDEITDFYLSEAGVEIAANFLSAWDRVTAHLQEHPDSGSRRLAPVSRVAALRVWPVKGFPHLEVYFRRSDTVVILRVLHAARDIPASFQD